MAIAGARPAQPWFFGWRSARHPRPRPAPVRSAHRARAHRRTDSRRDVRPLLLAIVIAAGLALVYLSQSTRVAATGYEIDALQATLAEQRAAHQQLISAIGHARSPAEITDRARRELGLVPLDEGAVQFVIGSVEPPPWSTIDD
jgi:cell division protein FtsB